MNTDGSFEFGGPWKSVEELQAAYPSIGDVALDIRRECVRSPLYLGHAIIQHDRKALLANPCEGHRRAEKAMVDQRNFLLLLPRGHLKCVRKSWYETVKSRVQASADQATWKIGVDSYIEEDIGAVARCYRVRTKSGRLIEVSGNHPFLTWGGWRSVDDGLRVGSWVAITRTTPFGVERDPKLAEMVGWMIGDANIKGMIVTIDAPEDRKKFIRLATECGFGTVETLPRNRTGGVRVHGMQGLWRSWGLMGARSWEKFVPEWVLNADRDTVFAFLRGLFYADATCLGGRMPGRNTIHTTVSERLARDVHHLLCKFGLRPWLTTHHIEPNRRVWNVTFVDLLGIHTDTPAVRHGPSPQDRFPPEWRGSVVCKPMNFLRERGVRIDNHYASTRDKVRRVAELTGNTSLSQMCDSDLSWDEVVEVTDLGPSEIVSIESGTHTLCIGDIVTHNTTVVDEIGTIWQLLKYPNDRILLMQASLENAKAIAGQVRQHFMLNPKLRYFFPEYAMNGKDEEGNILKFSVPCKRIVTREESVEIGTPGASLSGRHYDVVAASDLMNEQTTPPPCGNATAEEMMKVISWYATVDGLLESRMANPRAHKRMDATPWHDADLSAEIINNNGAGTWEVIKYGVERGDDGRFVPVWSEFPSEMLHEKHDSPTMTPYLWAANYAMEPKAEGGSIKFDRSYFRHYDEAPPGLSVAITVDPAWTDKRKRGSSRSDRSAVVVSGVAPGSGKLYVLDILAGRWGPQELIEQVFTKSQFWKPSWVGFEQDDKGLKAIWMMELQRNKRFIPYQTLKCGGKDKEQRAAPLIHLAAQWGIYVRKGVHDPLVEECARFPVGKHDDYVDALAYRAMDVLVPFGMTPEEDEEEQKRRETLGNHPAGRIITADVIKRQLSKARSAGDAPWTRTMKELRR